MALYIANVIYNKVRRIYQGFFRADSTAITIDNNNISIDQTTI